MANTAICSVHGRNRTVQNLMDDGQGGMCCAPGSECNGGGGSSSAPMMPGDWVCPSCGDHQFARNTSCRKCGAAKPMDAGMGGGCYGKANGGKGAGAAGGAAG